MEQTGNRFFLEWLNRSNRELLDIYRQIATSLGLSESEFWVMYILSDTTRKKTQGEICEKWFFHKQTINYAIRKLEERGYVHLEKAPGSRKKKYVVLTNLGDSFVRERILPIRRAEETAISKLSAEEKDAYIFLAQRHIKNLRKEAEGLICLGTWACVRDPTQTSGKVSSKAISP